MGGNIFISNGSIILYVKQSKKWNTHENMYKNEIFVIFGRRLLSYYCNVFAW